MKQNKRTERTRTGVVCLQRDCSGCSLKRHPQMNEMLQGDLEGVFNFEDRDAVFSHYKSIFSTIQKSEEIKRRKKCFSSGHTPRPHHLH